MIIDAPIKPTLDAPARPSGPTLKLRLSDGYSWSHEFAAGSPVTLRESCFEAWVAFLIERDCRCARRFPPHQTRNRERFKRDWPARLELHVFDDATRHWVNANYGTDSSKIIVIAQPGTRTACAWDDEPWETYWLRCLRCVDACYRLNMFCRQIPKMLNDGSDGGIA